MAISKFAKKNSLFKTTLSSGMQVSDTTMTLQTVPTGNVQYPNWFVVEPDSANAEIVYVPSDPSGTTYSSIIRFVSRSLDTDAAGTGIAHAANVDVVMPMTHRDWNDLVSVMQGTNGTGYNNFRVGDETASDIKFYAQNAMGSKPFIVYQQSTGKWLISNDGVSTYDISAGGSGLTRGPGVDIVASAITLDVRSSGGLRNNQGTGSQQCDVDPAIVARLDTANTWAAVQSVSADNLQITSDPDSANDAVRSSYLAAEVPKGAVQGTSGEAITAGQGVYLKASDGKLWKTDSDADESTFSFVGIALTTVAGADLAVEYAPPGHVVSGLTGLTSGSYYFITGTAGTLGTTPGTRFARVGFAISTTQMQVVLPKYVVKSSFSVSSTGDTSVTLGFYPAVIRIRASVNVNGIMSIGDDSNTCVYTATGSIDIGGSRSASLAANCKLSGSAFFTGTVSAKSATGFTWNTASWSTHTAYVQYEAESL